MSFDTQYKNRKDWRKPYRKSKLFDRSCRNHGSCKYCENNRLFSSKRREPLVDHNYEQSESLSNFEE